MRRGALAAIAAVALSLAACSGQTATGLDQMIYNATYVGQGMIVRLPPGAGERVSTPTLSVTMTLAQLGQDFSGTFSFADTSGHSVYSGAVTGRSTSAGADFTLVVPSPCPGALYGSFTVSNGELTGSATGRDCISDTTGIDVQITFTNLVRH
jgi:hypothetical protein